ncbi:hypothetical protein PENSPDRAFT_649105 [Peniophora sp. CONT]|nr:hypothetical protein PENSPDRAFT_649105 [Peniophora sp. CONT]
MAPPATKANTPAVSFIGIVDFTEKANWVFLSESVSELLGYEPRELVNTPSLDLVHPDEFPPVKQMHYDTISQDKAAALAYLRMKHKDPLKGYILCAITRTVAQNVLVGSVSYASEGAQAMRNVSTASAVEVVTPDAKHLAFRHWANADPFSLVEQDEGPLEKEDLRADSHSPPPPRTPTPPPPRRSRKELSPARIGDRSHSPPIPRRTKNRLSLPNSLPPASYDETGVIGFPPLPAQSVRTALFLDRFSQDCPITYVSNDNFVQTVNVMGRPFFDFVAKKDEELVKSWIEAVKAWGVNERGQPSDGGFGYGKFHLFLPGRDSRDRPDAPAPRSRRNSRGAASGSRSAPLSRQGSTGSRPSSSHQASAPVGLTSTSRHRDRPFSFANDERWVDAIFSAHSDGLVVIIRHAH